MLTITRTALRITVRLQPRSARNRVVGLHAGALKVQVNAPPVEGAANRALIDVLAAWLDIPRRAIRIVQGETSRDKVVEVSTDDPAALAHRVEAAAGRVDNPGGAD